MGIASISSFHKFNAEPYIYAMLHGATHPDESPIAFFCLHGLEAVFANRKFVITLVRDFDINNRELYWRFGGNIAF
jgi:hypothetical protein